MGRMTRQAGEMIGDVVGETLDVDVGEDETAIARIFRIKVKLQIDRPLMRGITIEREEEEDKAAGQMDAGKKEKEDRWCAFTYEYLPEFCYTCGIIGHTYKRCIRKLSVWKWNSVCATEAIDQLG